MGLENLITRYIFMLGLKLIIISQTGPWCNRPFVFCAKKEYWSKSNTGSMLFANTDVITRENSCDIIRICGWNYVTPNIWVTIFFHRSDAVPAINQFYYWMRSGICKCYLCPAFRNLLTLLYTYYAHTAIKKTISNSNGSSQVGLPHYCRLFHSLFVQP